MRQLSGKRALLTGANGGLGPFFARALADAGMDLVLSSYDTDRREDLCREVRDRGRRATWITGDLCEPGQIQRLADAAIQAFGGIDVLVNNAGIEYSREYHNLDCGQIRKVMELNLAAPMLLTHRLLPGMLKVGWGHIVNLSSLAGKSGPAFQEPYAATKAALVGFTFSLRATYSGTGVSASVICPGFVAAGIYSRLAASTGVTAPLLLSPVSPDSVARSMVNAIRRDKPEVIVSTYPVRPILALMALAPAVGLRVVGWLGTHRFFRRVALAQKSAPQ